MQVGNESCDRENKHREIVKLLEAILSELKRCETSAPGSTIRILPSCPGSVNVRQYNMRDPESRFAYLIDITDELLSYRNTHLEKVHANNNERVAWCMEQVKYLLERKETPSSCTIKRNVTSCLTTNCQSCRNQTTCPGLDQQKQQQKPTDCERYAEDTGVLSARNWI